MATNGILDITTEEYMGQDPEMQIDQNEMVEIISTLQIIGIPQDKHPEVLEAFKEWKQTKTPKLTSKRLFNYLLRIRTCIRTRRCTIFATPTSNYKSQCNQR